MRHIEVAFEHPANMGVLRHLRGMRSLSVAGNMPACAPESIKDVYLNLGTHPELVSRLWNEIATALPIRCDWVVYGAPALVRPETGIIFAFAGGTHTYALRLPPEARGELAAAAWRQAEARADQFAPGGRERGRYLRAQAGDVHQYADGSTFDVLTMGREWALGRWLAGEVTWCLAAYEHAS